MRDGTLEWIGIVEVLDTRRFVALHSAFISV